MLLPAITALAWQPPSCLEAPTKLLLHIITLSTDRVHQPVGSAVDPDHCHLQLRSRAALVQQTEGMLSSLWHTPAGGR